MEAFEGLVHSVFGLTLVRFLPTLATSVGTVTLIFITTWFYSDHCWEFKEPIDHQQISDYMCCEPGRTVGLIGLIAGSLLLICASVPIRDRFASLSATNRRWGLFMQVVLIFSAIGLMGVGIVDICWNHLLHDCFAETFFLFGLVLMWTYNAFFIWNAPPPPPTPRSSWATSCRAGGCAWSSASCRRSPTSTTASPWSGWPRVDDRQLLLLRHRRHHAGRHLVPAADEHGGGRRGARQGGSADAEEAPLCAAR